jgi:hypothetical protein
MRRQRWQKCQQIINYIIKHLKLVSLLYYTATIFFLKKNLIFLSNQPKSIFYLFIYFFNLQDTQKYNNHDYYD